MKVIYGEKLIPDDRIYEEFKKQYSIVDDVRKKLQSYVDKMEEYKEGCKRLELLKASYLSTRKSKEKKLGELIEDSKKDIERVCVDIEVSKKYLSNTASTQTLVDKSSQYGFYKEQDEWIGIPLWVHRRCQYPMFTISNKISYKGLMVQGKPRNGKARWYDIGGKANDKYVKEQGEFLVQKIKELIQDNPKINDKKEKDIIYVITPFSNVAYHLARELSRIHFTRYDEHGKPTNVGTVHTFQGKEAPIVFLVLGQIKAVVALLDGQWMSRI